MADKDTWQGLGALAALLVAAAAQKSPAPGPTTPAQTQTERPGAA